MEKFWIIQYDDAWDSTGAGIAAVVTSPLGIKLRYAARLEFCNEDDKCTNNVVEYEAVLLGLRKVRALGIKSCKVKTDSRVVASHVDKDYETREPILAKYLPEIRNMDKFFKGFDIEYVKRKNNQQVDALAKAAAKRQPLPSDVFYEVITKPSIRSSQVEAKLIQAITSQEWRAPLMAFINGYYQP